MTSYLGNMEGVAFITGAGSGIGRVCARNFAKLGAKLVLIDSNAQGLEAVKKECALPDDHILTGVVNVLDTPAVEAFVSAIPSKMGRIDFALFCAGILGPDYDAPLHEQKQSAWDLVCVRPPGLSGEIVPNKRTGSTSTSRRRPS
jgi:NAD(P)-dependent dehydrogenase (short-subunit alcohol dehydrogenase family)